MQDRRQRLVDIFQDTVKIYTEDAELFSAAQVSRKMTRLYEPDEYPDLPDNPKRACTVTVSSSTSFQAARLAKQKNPSSNVTVLNFASATNPGGGVTHGSSAQEESLCRCSTLYYALNNAYLWQNYYNPNRAAHDVLHTDACIYSPGIVILKTDDPFPVPLPTEQRAIVDVISCAAPNLRHAVSNQYNPEDGETVSLSEDEQYHLHLKRAMHILHIAAVNKADTLILGAFGCGAFYNNPWAVSKAYNKALEAYRCYFESIEFAVFCNPYHTENYRAFKAVIQETQ